MSPSSTKKTKKPTKAPSKPKAANQEVPKSTRSSSRHTKKEAKPVVPPTPPSSRNHSPPAAPNPVETRAQPAATKPKHARKEKAPAKDEELLIDNETDTLYQEFDTLSNERVGILENVGHTSAPSGSMHKRLSTIEQRMKSLKKALLKLGYEVVDERYSKFMQKEGKACFERQRASGQLDEYRRVAVSHMQSPVDTLFGNLDDYDSAEDDDYVPGGKESADDDDDDSDEEEEEEDSEEFE